MSGHSKWSQIKRQKGVKDAKRSNVFSKLGKKISIAARGDGDPETNFKLRLAIEKAREANMPNDNVERAIKRGTGEAGEGTIEEVVYEGYGPGGAAILIHALTDNKNRTVSDIRHLLAEYGGSIGNAGSVAWQFAPRGVVRILAEQLTTTDKEELELAMIDAGALDVKDQPEGVVVVTDPKNLEPIKTLLAERHITYGSANAESLPTQSITLSQKDHERLGQLVEALEEHDDVDAVFTNADA